MTYEDAIEVLYGQKVEVDSSVFTASPIPTNQWVLCEPRFATTRKGTGGWVDISGDRMYVTPTHGHGAGLYAPLSLIRRPA